MTRPQVFRIAVGLPIGIALGMWFAARMSAPPTSFLPNWLAPAVVTFFIVIALLVADLVWSRLARVRPARSRAFVAPLALVVGVAVGAVLGPRWQPSTADGGTIELELVGVSGVHAVPASCVTHENSEEIGHVIAEIGNIDGLPVSIELTLNPDNVIVSLYIDGAPDRSGPTFDFDMPAGNRAGTATFKDLVADDLDPDANGAWTRTAGTVRWDCS